MYWSGTRSFIGMVGLMLLNSPIVIWNVRWVNKRIVSSYLLLLLFLFLVLVLILFSLFISFFIDWLINIFVCLLTEKWKKNWMDCISAKCDMSSLYQWIRVSFKQSNPNSETARETDRSSLLFLHSEAYNAHLRDISRSGLWSTLQPF